MKYTPLTPVALATLILASACGSGAAPAAPAPAANPPAAPAAADPTAPPGVHAMPNATAEQAGTEGTVLETMDAASYTYMNVQTSAGPVWVAAMAMPVHVGDHVRFVGSEMRGFHSGTLDRTFDSIIFANSASVVGGGDAPAAPAPAPQGVVPAAVGNGPAPQQAPPLAPGQTELPPGHPAVPPAAAPPAAN